jgi:arylsulfatase A-like enzyme
MYFGISRCEDRARRFLGVFAVAVLLGCQAKNAPEPRLVLLYATCSLNRHLLQPYDPDVTYTPHLERLGRMSVVFKAHHTEAGQSGTSYASILSGTQAMRHGVYAHPRKLPDSLFLITEAFQLAGWKAFGFTRHPMASARLGYVQGVPKARRAPKQLTANHPKFVRVLDRLEASPDFKALVVTTFTATHYPYGEPGKDLSVRLREFCAPRPDECDAARDRDEFERLRRIYYGYMDGLTWNFEVTVAKIGLSDEDVARLAGVIELLYKLDVARLDRLFGRVLKAIEARGLLDETVIAFTADHGEILYRENAFFHWTHGYQQAPEVIGVPWILHVPGVEPRSYESVTRSIDVFPTLLGLSDLPYPGSHVQGVDLSAEIRGGTERAGLLAFSHSGVLPQVIVDGGELPKTEHFGSLFPRRDPALMWLSVRTGDRFYKLRRLSERGFTSFVFDLENDSTESTNLFDPEDSEQQRIFAKLETYREELLRGYEIAESGGDNVPKKEQVRLLRSLGYIE